MLGQFDVLGVANDRSDQPNLLDRVLFLLFDFFLVKLNMAIRLEEHRDEDLDLLVLKIQVGYDLLLLVLGLDLLLSFFDHWNEVRAKQLHLD